MPNEPINEPTPAQNGGNAPTQEPKSAEPEPKVDLKKLEFTQAELDEKFKERQERGEKAAAKRFQKQIDEMTAKLQEYENKGLSDAEKILRDYENSQGKVKELETSLSSVQLENVKLKALLNAAGLTGLTSLLKRVSGTSEEEVLADIEELKGLGWIKAPGSEQPAPRGLGTPTKTGEPEQKKSLREQLNEATAKMSDPKTASKERSALVDLSNQLQRRISRGET